MPQVQRKLFHFWLFCKNHSTSIVLVASVAVSAFLISTFVFNSYSTSAVQYKIGTGHLHDEYFNIEITITKIDEQIFQLTTNGKRYPKHGIFSTMHYSITNKGEKDVQLSNTIPLTDGKNTYYPLNTQKNIILPAGVSKSDVITFDIPPKTTPLQLIATYERHINFLLEVHYDVQI